MAKSFDNREGWIWMNGSFIPWKDATSHVISQGLHYASSVFEGERAYNGIIFKSREHTDRLFKSAEIMGIEIPYSKEKINEAKNALLKGTSMPRISADLNKRSVCSLDLKIFPLYALSPSNTALA